MAPIHFKDLEIGILSLHVRSISRSNSLINIKIGYQSIENRIDQWIGLVYGAQ